MEAEPQPENEIVPVLLALLTYLKLKVTVPLLFTVFEEGACIVALALILVALIVELLAFV